MANTKNKITDSITKSTFYKNLKDVYLLDPLCYSKYHNSHNGYYHECPTKPTISLSGQTYNKHNNNKEDLTIQGTFYIDANLSITNMDVYSDAILYVNGDVTIRESTLAGFNNGTLIIFASGNIQISNISEYQDTPSTIKGFFYSQNNMTLYGVGSDRKSVV